MFVAAAFWTAPAEAAALNSLRSVTQPYTLGS